jgi:sodium-dependent dicarboxylate transporter 2/3/5
MLAEATKTTGLDRRLAFALLRHRWASATPPRLLLSVGIVTCAMSLWLSNTATTALMLPVGLGLLRATGQADGTGGGPFATALLLMLSWSSSVAVGIPVGSPPNLSALAMVRDFTDRRLTFFDWTAVAMPLTVAMLLLCWLILRWSYPVPPGGVALDTYLAAALCSRWRPAPTTRSCVGRGRADQLRYHTRRGAILWTR